MKWKSSGSSKKCRVYPVWLLLIFLLCSKPGFSGSRPDLTATQVGSIRISVKNKSSVHVYQKAIFVPMIHRLVQPMDHQVYLVLLDEQSRTIPCQLIRTDRVDSTQDLFFVTDLSPHATRYFYLSWSIHEPYIQPVVRIRFRKRTAIDAPLKELKEDHFYPSMLLPLTGFQPYQTDGPTWENDKIGFRHYFDGRNAKDVFGKRVSSLSPDSVGISATGQVEDNYHVLKDWGRDILPVGSKQGLSVGLGGVGLWFDSSLHRIGVTGADSVHTVASTRLKIQNNGPFYASFDLRYDDWTPAPGRTYTFFETPAIWPGMFAYRNQVSCIGLSGKEQLVVGLPKVATEKNLATFEVGDWVVLYTHDQQTYNREFMMGMAIVVPRKAYLGWGKAPESGSFAHSYFARLRVQNNHTLVYYAVAGWELSDPKFRNESGFVDYLNQFVSTLQTPMQVRIKKWHVSNP
jgi:hypothetical protein